MNTVGLFLRTAINRSRDAIYAIQMEFLIEFDVHDVQSTANMHLDRLQAPLFYTDTVVNTIDSVSPLYNGTDSYKDQQKEQRKLLPFAHVIGPRNLGSETSEGIECLYL